MLQTKNVIHQIIYNFWIQNFDVTVVGTDFWDAPRGWITNTECGKITISCGHAIGFKFKIHSFWLHVEFTRIYALMKA